AGAGPVRRTGAAVPRARAARRQTGRARARGVPASAQVRPRTRRGLVPGGGGARAAAALRRGGADLGEGDGARSRRAVRAARAHARAHRARPAAHLRVGRGLTHGDRRPAPRARDPRRVPAPGSEPENGGATRHLGPAPQRGHDLFRGRDDHLRRDPLQPAPAGRAVAAHRQDHRGRPRARARHAAASGGLPPPGEILVSLGALTRRELQRQVRFQIEEVVFEVMSWREGYFSFTEGPLSDVATETAVRIPTEALLMEGARRIDEWSRIESRIPHLGVIPTLAPPAGGAEGELDLLPPEWEMLAMIDGERDLRTIASELGRSEFDVAKTLFGLESAGIVVLVDAGTAKRERTTLTSDLAELVARAEAALGRRELEEARTLAEQAAGVHPHDPTVHLLLGRIDLAAGRPAAV